ncbi:hypothetical protein [Haliangium sp.]|uniref:hypothetical protein n=1 Tax=Haliangium sp. TaxID=2663208 RepID=UPI003D0EC6CF
MHKNSNDKNHKANQKGRVLARELSEELRYVAGGYKLATFTQVADPDWDFDRD